MRLRRRERKGRFRRAKRRGNTNSKIQQHNTLEGPIYSPPPDSLSLHGHTANSKFENGKTSGLDLTEVEVTRLATAYTYEYR